MSLLMGERAPEVWFKGKHYTLNLSYDTVLLVQQLYGDERLDNGDKITQALKLMVKSRFKVWLLGDIDRAKLLEEITKKHIAPTRRVQSAGGPKLMDFRYDGGYIYASFQQAYGLDLTAECGRMSWQKFIDLLDGLPDKTKIKEVMRIRAMELPEPTRTNRKEIQNILRLKSYYALPVSGGGGKDGLNLLFETLEKGARKI